MHSNERPAWPPRSLVDPACVRGILGMLVDELLMWWAGRVVVDQALADVRALRGRERADDTTDPASA